VLSRFKGLTILELYPRRQVLGDQLMALKTNGASVPNQGAEMEKILSPKGTSDVDRCGSVFDRIFGTKASKMSGKYRKFLHRRRGVDAEWSVQIPHDAG
jgi:hypothetical protein